MLCYLLLSSTILAGTLRSSKQEFAAGGSAKPTFRISGRYSKRTPSQRLTMKTVLWCLGADRSLVPYVIIRSVACRWSTPVIRATSAAGLADLLSN
jgi:hypothetical protein